MFGLVMMQKMFWPHNGGNMNEGKSFESVLKLKKMQFDKIEFNRVGHRNNNKLVFRFQTDVTKRESDGVYKVSLGLYGDKEAEYTFEIRIEGFFTFEFGKDECSKELEYELITKNAVAILMPYLRSEVSILTAQPEVECVVLPPFNIIDMLEQ